MLHAISLGLLIACSKRHLFFFRYLVSVLKQFSSIFMYFVFVIIARETKTPVKENSQIIVRLNFGNRASWFIFPCNGSYNYENPFSFCRFLIVLIK